VGEILEQLTNTLPEDFNMFDLKMAIGENITPYLVVLMQESERFNGLLREMRQDLKEMRMGLDGALNITDKMVRLLRLNYHAAPPKTPHVFPLKCCPSAPATRMVILAPI
jgi:hypothetical protein